MKEATKEEKQNAKAYEETDAKQFGNLHERMKFLTREINGLGEKSIPSSLRWAVFDLETEVKHYTPKNPPFGSKVGYTSPNLRKT